jgi:hypothetical protein
MHLKLKLLYNIADFENGGLAANPAKATPPAPEKPARGHHISSTLDDCFTFLLTILNYGKHPLSEYKS